MKMILVETKSLYRVYETAGRTDPTDPEDVNYLLGVIDGALGKFFTVDDTGNGCDCKNAGFLWHTVDCGEKSGQKVE